MTRDSFSTLPGPEYQKDPHHQESYGEGGVEEHKRTGLRIGERAGSWMAGIVSDRERAPGLEIVLENILLDNTGIFLVVYDILVLELEVLAIIELFILSADNSRLGRAPL